MTRSIRPAIEGWFTVGDDPVLLGSRCTSCGTVVFPPSSGFCPSPHCDGEELEEHRLAATGRVWSYTDAQYQPPPPYVQRSEEYEPFALAAVALEQDGLVVLGQVADGFRVGDLRVGDPVELVVEPLYEDGDETVVVWRWRPLRQEERSDV